MLLNLQRLPCLLPFFFSATLVLNVRHLETTSIVTFVQSQFNALEQLWKEFVQFILMIRYWKLRRKWKLPNITILMVLHFFDSVLILSDVLNDETQRKYIQVSCAILLGILLYWLFYILMDGSLLGYNIITVWTGFNIIINYYDAFFFCKLQGLKRLMTFCQKKFPADPSKSVEYNAVTWWSS